MTRGRTVSIVLVLTVAAGCSGDDDPGAAGTPAPSSPPSSVSTPPPSSTSKPAGPVKLTVTGTIATGIQVPWGIAFLPDKTALVAERDSAKVKHIVGTRVTEVGTVPDVDPSSEGGLLGLAVDPQFRTRPFVYAYYSSTDDDNRIARFSWRDGRIADPQVILDGIPSAAIHNGGRLAFGPDGFLYVGTGEAGERDDAPRKDNLGGKILRITGDGKPAPGNPDPSSPVYSIGHRNVQGLAFGADRTLYAAEFGQQEWDELNTIRAGANYGWPAAEGIAGLDGLVDPIAQWTVDVASPSGIAFARDHVFMAGLRGERLWAIPVAAGRRTGEPRAFFTNQFGRLRTVVAAPDGSLWLSTSNTDGRADPRDGDDRILRVVVE